MDAINNKINEFINEFIRPRVQGDGGEIMFENLVGDDLTLVLMGDCAVCNVGCDMAKWVGKALKNEFNKDFNIILKRKTRYFQDK